MREFSLRRLGGTWLAVVTTGMLALDLNLSNAIAQQRPIAASSPVLVPAAAAPTQERPLPAPETVPAPASTAGNGDASRNLGSGRQHSRWRAVERAVAGRIAVNGGVLVLPTVSYFGMPIILDVPD